MGNPFSTMSYLPDDPSFLPSDDPSGGVDETHISAMRDQAVIDIWKGQACPNIADPTDAKILEELQSLHNQYCTAMTVFAKAGIRREPDAEELSDEDKRMTIEIAKSIVLSKTLSQPDPVLPTLGSIVDAVVAEDERDQEDSDAKWDFDFEPELPMNHAEPEPEPDEGAALTRTTTAPPMGRNMTRTPELSALERLKTTSTDHGWKMGGL